MTLEQYHAIAMGRSPENIWGKLTNALLDKGSSMGAWISLVGRISCSTWGLSLVNITQLYIWEPNKNSISIHGDFHKIGAKYEQALGQTDIVECSVNRHGHCTMAKFKLSCRPRSQSLE